MDIFVGCSVNNTIESSKGGSVWGVVVGESVCVTTCTVDIYVGCNVNGTNAKPTKFTRGHTEQSLIHVVRKVRLTSARASL